MALKNYTLLFGITLLLAGCEKFLDEKSDKKLAVPSTVADLQALLDDYANINSLSPTEGEISADDYYLTDDDWAGLSYESFRDLYIWKDKIALSDLDNFCTWGKGYEGIYRCNTVLEGLAKIEKNGANKLNWDNVKGQALYLRADYLFERAVVWCLAYDNQTADTDLGLPLRLDTDFNKKSARSTLEETYGQIIQDLNESVTLLPTKSTSTYRTSRPAAYALLARVYLSMRDYENAYLNADLCLSLYDELVNYNDLMPSETFPIKKNNPEVIFNRFLFTAEPIASARAKINEELYGSYQNDDIRKAAYFRANTDGTFRFKGSYQGGSTLYSGIATDEVYLMRAECSARMNRKEEALQDLNHLLANRLTAGKFVPLTVSSSVNILSLILSERRKELLFRGLRWMDIKRLNKEGSQISLSRIINGQTYSLPANDIRFAIPIPDDVISMSDIIQNPL